MAAGDSLEAWISSSRAAAEEHERKARFLRESIGWKQAGLLAERAVGRELDALGRVGWRVLHDRAVPGSPANIDHLLVGPPGIVVIDAKAHKGTLTMDAGGPRVGGRAFSDKLDKLVRYSRTVEASSGRRTSVYSVICFTEHVGLEQPRQVGAVTLLELRQLLAWLGQLPASWRPVRSGISRNSSRSPTPTVWLLPLRHGQRLQHHRHPSRRDPWVGQER